MVHPLKNILNKLFWGVQTGDSAENYVIVYRHRGAPGEAKQILASDIRKLGKSYFTLSNQIDGEETVIPFHRVLEIRSLLDGKVLWKKRIV